MLVARAAQRPLIVSTVPLAPLTPRNDMVDGGHVWIPALSPLPLHRGAERLVTDLAPPVVPPE